MSRRSPQAFGVFRAGETSVRGFPPYALFTARRLALLAAALLPGTGREAPFRLQKEAGPSGCAVTERGGEEVGHLQLFDEKLVDALNVLDALLRTPEALAGVLEAAGTVALERAGAILEERFPGTGSAAVREAIGQGRKPLARLIPNPEGRERHPAWRRLFGSVSTRNAPSSGDRL